MLKPLLRTIPALSGNIKIACTLSDYTKIGANDWTSYVRLARLLPISSNLAQRNIDTNLLFSSYDFDVQKFFKYYSSVFYDDVYEYDKSNYVILNKSESQKNRNTDFEFGCKRVSWQKNDCQFAFYAPIYIESINDLPDYFKISITLENKKYKISRNIRIQISKNDKLNYLKIYLERYLNKIDSNVIFCNVNGKNAIYYGIDALNGGCIKVSDNIIAKAFTKQNTINNFDAIITNGFKRNNLVIRQILPFCWYFNVNDILTNEEINKFRNCNLYITGHWYKDGKIVPFYNIDTNYKEYYEAPFIINKSSGLFVYKNNSNNIMNMEYPSLNESMYTGYRYTNKMNLMYNRWKLKYSSDEHPYITNLSPAFSINQKSIYKYGGFPEKYKSLNLITDTKNNVIIPIGNGLKLNESPYKNDYKLVSNYISTLNNNVSTWYHLTNDISNIYKEDIWKPVIDNKVYYKGILYDFTGIYERYPDTKNKIDKFSVIVNLHFNKIPQEELSNINKADTSIFISDKYRTDKTAWISERIPEFIKEDFSGLPMFYNTASSFANGNAQLVFDRLYQKDEKGDFIDMLSLGYDFYEVNKYYKYSDILYIFTKNEQEDLLNDSTLQSYFTEGFELLPIYKLYNVLHENNRDIVFEKKECTKWILDNLYFSQHGNYYKSPYDRDTLIKLIREYGNTKFMIPLYLKSKFINKALFNSIINTSNLQEDIVNELSVYEYQPRLKDNTSATYAADTFIKKDSIMNDNYGNNIPSNKENTDNDVLYIDPYNMNNVGNVSLGTGIDMYAKFLNMKHLNYYVIDLYKNESSQVNLEQLMSSIFIKKRVIIGDEEKQNLLFKDYYIPFYVLYDRYRPLTKDEKKAIINGTSELTEVYIKNKKAKKYYSTDSYHIILLNEDINEYHIDDFYFKPDFYVLSDNTYIKFVDYIKDKVNINNESLLKYLSYDLIEFLLSNDVNKIDVNKIPFNVGIHESKRPFGLNNPTVNLSKGNNDLDDLKKEILRLIKKVNSSIYYKVDNIYEQYNNFKGINEYVLLTDSMKLSILDGNLKIKTYVINENGEFVKKKYDSGDEYCTLKSLSDENYIKETLNTFLSDIKYFEDSNCYKMSDNYNRRHDFDNLLGLVDYDTPFKTQNLFEICYKKTFYKINDSIFNLINLDGTNNYKDLYIYKAYKVEDYPAALRMYYLQNEDTAAISEEITNCLYPFFDDIMLQDKKYTVIYSEYAQANIYKVNSGNDHRYRYNASDVMMMFDTSGLPFNQEYNVNGTKYYTYSYYWDLQLSEDEDLIRDANNHQILPTYSLINNCYTNVSYINDSLNIFDDFNINTYTITSVESYIYNYTYKAAEEINGKFTIIDKEGEKIGLRDVTTTYGFILLDAYVDNTNSSFNIIDTKYKRKKYFTYVNEHSIYEEDFDLLDSFNLLVPFSNINIVDNLSKFTDIIIPPTKKIFNTYYKQTPCIDDSGYTYAYDINMKGSRIDTLTLQRYFDNIVPYIPKTNIMKSSYCLKYKNYKRVNTNVNYINDVFYSEDINMYNYNKLRVYDSKGSYELFEPIEYKHLNDNKLINLPESFSIKEKGKYTYDELIGLEKDENVFNKFKEYVLQNKLNTFNDDEILFLYNRYNIEYEDECVGLNALKTHKLYTLTYKFTLL